MEKGSTSFWTDIKKYEDILSKEPNSYCFALLSELYRKLGLLDDAVAVAKKGMGVHPEYLGGYMALGRAYFEMGHREDAKALLEKVAMATPENVHAQKILSQIYQEEGNLCSAEKALDLLVTFNPGDTESMLALESLRRSMELPEGQKITQEPCAELSQEGTVSGGAGEAVAPDDGTSFSSSSDSIDPDQCEPEEETSDFDVASPSGTVTSETGTRILPLSTFTLAELYEAQGVFESALEVYSDLLEKDPDNSTLQKKIASLKLSLEKKLSPSVPLSQPEMTDFSSISELSRGGIAPDFSAGETGPSGVLTHDEKVLELLGAWLDAVRRRKECR